MNQQGVSSGLSNRETELQPDKRWLGTLLCCLSALVTTMIIVLVATSLTATDDRDIARGDGPSMENMTPAHGGIPD